MPSVHSVWARIAPDVKEHRSFRGLPKDRDDSLELIHADVAAMRDTIVGVPICWNHEDSLVCGSVGASRESADGRSWDVRMDITDDTPIGKKAMEWVVAGALAGVSLKHVWGSNRPIEVSLCPRGARDGSGIIRDANTGQYTRSFADGSVIAASSTEEDQKYGYFILTAEPIVVAAAAAAATETMASSAAAAAPSLSLQPFVPTTPAPAAAAAAAAAPAVAGADDTEMKDAAGDGEPGAADDAGAELNLADYPELAEIKNKLSESHTIPTRADKEAIFQIATDLQHKSDEALNLAAEKESENAKLRAEIERMKTEASGDKLANTRIMNDMLNDFATDQDLIEVQASLSLPANKGLRDIIHRCDRRREDEERQLGKESVINNATHLKLRGMISDSQSKKNGKGLTRGASATTTPTVSASAMSAHRPTYRRPQQQQQQQAQEEIIVDASRDFSSGEALKPGHSMWGVPQSRRTVNMVVAASRIPNSRKGRETEPLVSRMRAQQSIDAADQGEAEPGTYLNFPWGKACKTEGQMLVLAGKGAYFRGQDVPELKRMRQFTPAHNLLYERNRTAMAEAGMSRENMRDHAGPWYPSLGFVERS